MTIYNVVCVFYFIVIMFDSKFLVSWSVRLLIKHNINVKGFCLSLFLEPISFPIHLIQLNLYTHSFWYKHNVYVHFMCINLLFTFTLLFIKPLTSMNICQSLLTIFYSSINPSINLILNLISKITTLFLLFDYISTSQFELASKNKQNRLQFSIFVLIWSHKWFALKGRES